MTDSDFVYVIYIATTPEKLWQAITDGDFTEKYFFGRKVQSEWNEGSEVIYLRENDELDVYGKVLKSEPPHLLSFTWFHADEQPQREKPSRVTFEITPLGETVKLTLKHEDVAEGDIVEDNGTFFGLNNGWPAILSNLKSLLETGNTLPAVHV